MHYVIRRMLHGLALLLAVSVLSFAMAELAPGDFLSDLELDPSVSKETVERLRERYGLDEPPVVRYVQWIRSVLRGELGFSVGHQTTAGSLLLPRARNTLFLATTALLLAWLAAVPLGVWSAYRLGSLLDKAALVVSSLLLATPALLLGLVALLIAARSDYFPIGGMTSLDFHDLGTAARLRDLIRHLAMPSIALALAGLPAIYRHTRAAVAEALEAPFVTAIRAHGIRPGRLLFRHTLKAAANPLVSLFGLSIAGLLSGSLLVEVIMAWPGLGPLMLEAIRARDVHVVVGAVLLSSVFLVSGNLVADLLLFWIDPRTRES